MTDKMYKIRGKEKRKLMQLLEVAEDLKNSSSSILDFINERLRRIDCEVDINDWAEEIDFPERVMKRLEDLNYVEEGKYDRDENRLLVRFDYDRDFDDLHELDFGLDQQVPGGIIRCGASEDKESYSKEMWMEYVPDGSNSFDVFEIAMAEVKRGSKAEAMGLPEDNEGLTIMTQKAGTVWGCMGDGSGLRENEVYFSKEDIDLNFGIKNKKVEKFIEEELKEVVEKVYQRFSKESLAPRELSDKTIKRIIKQKSRKLCRGMED